VVNVRCSGRRAETSLDSVLTQQHAGDQEPGDQEEHVDADEPARGPTDQVIGHHGDDRDRSQTWTSGRKWPDCGAVAGSKSVAGDTTRSRCMDAILLPAAPRRSAIDRAEAF
jgi:hypothetical protein